MPEVCHKRGMLAIGGMTALYPSREDPELNARALAILEKDKKNEADQSNGRSVDRTSRSESDCDRPVSISPTSCMQGGHRQKRYPDLRPAPTGVGARTVAGTRAAVRTAIRYRNGVLNGKGASLLDGYMEDLATDRIYRLMIAQRMRHNSVVDDAGKIVAHTPEFITQLFDEELEKLLANPGRDLGTVVTFRESQAD